MFLKRVLLLSLGSLSVFGLIVGAEKWRNGLEINSVFLDKIFDATKNLRNVSLNSSIDSNVSNSRSPFVYSILSSNLGSFTKSFKEHFSRWYLFEWADSFLKNTNKDSFSAQKQKVFNRFFELKKSYDRKNSLNSPDPKKWLQNNYITTESYEVLKSSFENVFFSEIYTDNGEIKMSEAEKKKFSENNYSNAIVDFQKFLFDEWFENEKPVIFCKKSWKYSDSFASQNPYKKDEEGLEIPSKPDFKFPDFSSQKDEISNFISNNLENGDICSGLDSSIHTISDLTKIKDGYELSGFLYRYGKDPSDLTAIKKEVTDIKDKDPLEIFLKKTSDISSDASFYNSWTLNSEIIGPTGALKDQANQANQAILNFVNIKKTIGETEKYGTFVRTKEGMTFLYRSEETEELKKSILTNGNKQKHQLKDKLKEYFFSNSVEVIGKYLDNEAGKKQHNIFGHRSWDSSIYSLLKSVSDFLTHLNKNQKHWGFLKTLSSATQEFSKSKTESKTESNKFVKSIGLATPIQLKRHLNKTDSIDDSEWIKDIKDKNDGNYDVLKDLMSNTEDRESLHKSSLEVKKHLSDYINSRLIHSKVSDNKSSYFFNDYILDNVYYELKNKEGFLRKSTVGIYLLNGLNFDFFKNNLKSFVKTINLKKYLSSKSELSNIEKLIEEGIVEGFYGSKYMGESMEDRLNYGGFKPEEDRTRTISSAGSSVLNSSEFNKKLKHYWLMKNYFFNDYGYEINSEEMNEYLIFLFSLKSMFDNDFHKFREMGSSMINANKFGVIAWLNKVNKVNSSDKPGEKEDESGKTTLKTIDFKRTEHKDLFNPWFSREIQINGFSNDEKSLTASEISAFAKVDNNGKRELYGFKGFIPKYGENKELKNVYEAIFNNFQKSNTDTNKSFCLLKEPNLCNDKDSGVGNLYGYSYLSYANNIDEFVDSFRTIEALDGFFDNYLHNEYSSVKIEISKLNQLIGLEEKKQKIKDIFKQKDYSNLFEKIKKASSRFSGFLENPDLSNSTFQDRPYFIGNESASTEGYIVYVIQVNKHDFHEGFGQFIEEIGFRTLLKTIILFSMEKHVNSNSLNSYLLDMGIVL